jgi:hypothetical protein
MNILQGDRFGADMSAAEGIVLVSPNRLDPVSLQDDLDTAHGLAQVASTVMMPHGLWFFPSLLGRC